VINITPKEGSLKRTANIHLVLFSEVGHGRATVSMKTAFKIYNLVNRLAKLTGRQKDGFKTDEKHLSISLLKHNIRELVSCLERKIRGQVLNLSDSAA